MKTLTDQLEQLAELQKNNLEPVRQLNHVALEAFERIARKNYELMGDMVEYAVSQSRGQLEPGTPQERLERQMTHAKAFAERIGARAGEYAELASELRAEAVGTGSRVVDKAETTATRTAARATEAAGQASPAGTSKSVSAKGGSATKSRATAKKAAGASDSAESKVVGKKRTTRKSAAAKGEASKRSASKASGKKTAGKKAAGKKAAAKGRGKRTARA